MFIGVMASPVVGGMRAAPGINGRTLGRDTGETFGECRARAFGYGTTDTAPRAHRGCAGRGGDRRGEPGLAEVGGPCREPGHAGRPGEEGEGGDVVAGRGPEEVSHSRALFRKVNRVVMAVPDQMPNDVLE